MLRFLTRPSLLQEARASLKLALPLAFTQFLSMLMITVDVVMLGRVGEEYLAAMGAATAVFSFFYLASITLVQATAPIAAQALGAKQSERVGPIMRQGFIAGLWIALGSMAAILIVGIFVLPLFIEGALLDNARTYLFWVMPAMIFGAWTSVVRSFLAVIGRQNVIIGIMLTGFLVNAALNALFIYGLGIILQGVAIATIVSYAMMVVASYIAIDRMGVGHAHRIFDRLTHIDWKEMAEIWRIGLPMAGAVAIEVTMFSVAGLWMARFGEAPMAAHQVALNIASLTFMIALGLAQASAVRVGYAAGAGDYHGMRRVFAVNMGYGLFFMGLAAAAFLLIPEFIVGLYLGADGSALVMQYAVTFLAFAALFQLVDAAQVVASGALRGIKDTRAAFILAAVSYWFVGMPLCYVFGFSLGLDGNGIWLGLAAGLGVAAILLVWRFLHQCRVLYGAPYGRLAE